MGCSSSLGVGQLGASAQLRSNFQEEYKLGSKIGAGAFGQVRVAVPRSKAARNDALAVKIIDARLWKFDRPLEALDQELATCAKSELKLWRQVGSHPNCVELRAGFLEFYLYYMVMEKCDCCLTEKLVEMGTIGEQDLKATLRGMLLGIQHVHSKGIAHRDIKLENFLCVGDTIKICDFGLAEQMPKKGLMRGVAGTAPYMSPEMLLEKGYDLRTDVWSFGVCLYLLLFGDFPYVPAEDLAASMKNEIRSGLRPPSFAAARGRTTGCSQTAQKFVKDLLCRAPAERRDATEVLEQPFLVLSSQDSSCDPTLLQNGVRRVCRQLTQELNQKVDPTRQKGLDELLAELQGKYGVSRQDVESMPSLFFSEEPYAENLRKASKENFSQPNGEMVFRRNNTCPGLSSEPTSKRVPCDEVSLGDESTEGSDSEGLNQKTLCVREPSDSSASVNAPFKRPKDMKDIPAYGDDGIVNDESEGFVSHL